jgi:hypothetical protein
MKKEFNYIDCAQHGRQRSCALCSHLIHAAGLGFNTDDPTNENPFPDAFCDFCQAVLEEENGWTERAKELVPCSIVCGQCYLDIRLRNLIEWRFPEPVAEIKSVVTQRQGSGCAQCGELCEDEKSRFHFVVPPHALPKQAQPWAISADNIVLLCSTCFNETNGNRNIVTIWFLSSNGKRESKALARPIGNHFYRILQTTPSEIAGIPGDVIVASLRKVEEQENTASYFIFEKLVKNA